ncbi:MAG: arylesterase [Desulfobulbales bacterium]|nr:arylesterase [Desulfobulbales bacterium]
MKTGCQKIVFQKLCGLLFCLGVFVLVSCSDEQKPTPDSNPPAPANRVYDGTIMAMGDSLTAGLGVAEEDAYPAVLQKKLQQNGYNWQVINGGISGETSSGALSRTNWIINQQPDIVILETGANDGMRGIPTGIIAENIRQAVLLFKAAEIEVVLAGMQMLQNLGPVYTEEFAALYPALAEELNIILVPFFLEQVAGDPSLNQPDTIHPTPAGYQVVVQNLYPYVVEAIRQSLQ